jgi:hypothetical protein
MKGNKPQPIRTRANNHITYIPQKDQEKENINLGSGDRELIKIYLMSNSISY